MAGALSGWGALPATAQGVFRFQPGGGELGSDNRGVWTSYGDSTLSRSLEFVGWVAVPVGGVFLDPRLLSWRATFRPELRRTDYTGAPALLRGSAFNWSGSAQLFGSRPVGLLVDGGRGRSVSEGGFGFRSEARSSSLGASLTMRNQWFPMLLSWRRQSTTNDWRSEVSGDAFQTAFDTRTLRFTGTSTKTSILVERTVQDDRTGPVDFRGWTVLLNHTAHWGKGSSLQSSYELGDQSGLFGFQRRQWTERLRLQHTRSVATAWSWRRGTTASRGQSSQLTTLTGDATVGLFRHLSFSLAATRDRTVFATGREHATLLQPRLSLDWPLARRVRLWASGGAGHQWRNLQGAAELTVPVLGERHLVSPSRRFTVDLPDADPTTVVVRREDQSVVYQEGSDYLVVVEGSVLRVDVPPGSRILVGETVLVSYRARLAGDFRDEATVTDLNATFTAGPLQLHHGANTRSSRIGSAQADARGYGEYHENQTTLDLRVGTPLGLLTLDAARLRRKRPRDDTRERRVGVTLGDRGGGRWQTSIGGFYSWAETNEVTVTSLSGTATLGWMITRTLRAHLSLDGLRWQDSRGLTDRFVGGMLDVEWRLGQIETLLRAEHQRRVDGSSYVLNRLSLRTVRRF